MKKLIAALAGALLAFSAVSCASSAKAPKEPPLLFNKAEAVTDTGSKPMKDISAIELVKDMRCGWNLGNSLDATGGGLGSETSWGQPKTTKAMIDTLAASGIKTIRIPITWHNHKVDQNYTIDTRWMNRVKEIVDWAIENDMYVVMNTHHDNFNRNTIMPYGYGYYPTEENKAESLLFLRSTWAQICLAFNNGYDEHLVFETLNEPRLEGTPQEWNYSSSTPEQKEAQLILNEFNQAIVDVIRASGGNNAKRLISIPGYACTAAAPLSDEFVLPNDPANNLAVAVHMYAPYNFAMDGNGTKTYNAKMAVGLQSTMKSLANKFQPQGVAVYVGEYGAINKENLEDRVQYFSAFNKLGRKFGMPLFIWDNQAVNKDKNGYTEKFGYYNRRELKWFFPEILEAVIEATEPLEE